MVSVSGRFDTNIDHDQEEFQTWGIVVGAGLQYRFEGDDTEWEVGYEIARHEYRDAPRWSRIGHTVQAGFERDLGGPWKLDVLGEASLGGSTEDRELANVYSLRPRLELEIDDASELRLKTALRFKRFDGEPERNATAPYAGLEYRRRIGRAARWSIATRYEIKRTPSERSRYGRWTHEMELALPAGSGRIELGVKVRMKNYASRLVETGGGEALRRDQRIKPSLSWIQPIGDRTGLRLDYDYESRFSNDPRKRYDAHAFGLRLWAMIP